MWKRDSFILAGLIMFLMICIPLHCLGEVTQPKSFQNVQEAIAYASAYNEEELNLGSAGYTVDELYQIREVLPKTCRLTFSFQWAGLEISSDNQQVDLNQVKTRISAEQLRKLVLLLPDLQTVDVLSHRELKNQDMIPLVDEFPAIDFTWLIHLGKRYSLSSGATAFSTMKKASSGEVLNSESCAVLKYARHLRALDLGHHRITNIDFLFDLPELRILILACNQIEDITPLAALPHLQYVELFNNQIKDLSPLEDHTELLDLNISVNPIRKLSSLEKSEKMERLWACGTDISVPEQQLFAIGHPVCQANYSCAHPTADGWRKHWRYDQYIAMFKAYTWSEFVSPE